MKLIKLTSVAILAGVSCFTSTVLAGDDGTMNMQESKNSLVYVGGMAGYSTVNGTMENQLGLGGDVLFMEKVWGNVALGLNGNFTFGISRNIAKSAIKTDGSLEIATGNEKQTLNNYNLSAVIGGIADHQNGGRLAYFIGPSIWGTTQKFVTIWDEAPSSGVQTAEWNNNNFGYGVAAGAYYQLPKSHWTIGLNGFANVTESGGGKVAFSVGYAF